MARPSADSDPRGQSDEALMVRYANGDDRAFEVLFDRYEARLFAFLRRRTSSDDRAADLFQELFLRLHRARDRYDPDRPFAPWIFRIARNLLTDDGRRAFRRLETDFEFREPAVSASAEARTEIERMPRMLAELSPEERVVVLGAKLDGVAYQQIATDLGKSVAAVRQIASRAVRKLRRAARETGLLEAADRR